MKTSKNRRVFAGRAGLRRAPRRQHLGYGLAGLVLVAAIGLPTAAIAAPVTTVPQPPGPASPVQAPPEIVPQIVPPKPHDGVITPPSGISRMPVIKPRVPTRTPVIPPAGSPGSDSKVIPK